MPTARYKASTHNPAVGVVFGLQVPLLTWSCRKQNLCISSLRRFTPRPCGDGSLREGIKLRQVGFDIQHRRTVPGIEALHLQTVAIPTQRAAGAQAQQIGAGGRTGGKDAGQGIGRIAPGMASGCGFSRGNGCRGTSKSTRSGKNPQWRPKLR